MSAASRAGIGAAMLAMGALAACAPGTAPPDARTQARCHILADRQRAADASESIEQQTDLRERSTFIQGCVAEQKP